MSQPTPQHKSPESSKLPDAQNLKTPSRPDWPAPMSEDAFYGVAGDFVRLVEDQTEADPHALLASFLLMSSLLFGRRVYVRVGKTKHFCNEYVALVGPTGSGGRKGMSLDYAASIFDEKFPWISKQRFYGISSGEGLIQKMMPSTEYEDSMRDVRSYLGVLTELAVLMTVSAREGNTASMVVRQAWDGQTLESPSKKSPLRAENAFLSFIGHITPKELLATLTTTDRANGLANRFMFLAVRRSKELPEGGEDVSLTEIGERLIKARSVVLEHPGEMREMCRNAEAKHLWAVHYHYLITHSEDMTGAILSRAEAHVLRLSMLYALLDCSPDIQSVHVRAALAFWDYCKRSVEFYFGGSSGDPDGDRIVEFACEHGQIMRSNVHQLFNRNRTAEWEAGKLAQLVREGKLIPDTGLDQQGHACEIWRPPKAISEQIEPQKPLIPSAPSVGQTDAMPEGCLAQVF
jgi:hypothetical protein